MLGSVRANAPVVEEVSAEEVKKVKPVTSDVVEKTEKKEKKEYKYTDGKKAGEANAVETPAEVEPAEVEVKKPNVSSTKPAPTTPGGVSSVRKLNLEVEPVGEVAEGKENTDEGAVETPTLILPKKVTPVAVETPSEEEPAVRKVTVAGNRKDLKERLDKLEKENVEDVWGSSQGLLSLQGVVRCNTTLVNVKDGPVYVKGTAVVGYLLKNEGLENLEFWDDKIVDNPSGRSPLNIRYQTLLTTRPLSEVPKSPWAVGEVRQLTLPALSMLEGIHELGNNVGIGLMIDDFGMQLRDLFGDLFTESDIQQMLSEISYNLSVKNDKLLVEGQENNPIASRAPMLKLSAKLAPFIKKRVAELVKGFETEQEQLAFIKVVNERTSSSRIRKPIGLTLPVNLFPSDDNGNTGLTERGSSMLPEFTAVYGGLAFLSEPRVSSTKGVDASGKQRKQKVVETNPIRESAVSLAEYLNRL